MYRIYYCTIVGYGSKLRQMGSVHALRLRVKSDWKTKGFASIKIPPQLYAQTQ